MERPWRQRLATSLFVAALLASVLPWGIPPHATVVRTARELAPMPMPARRVAVTGEWLAEVERIRAATRPRAPIDLVIADTRSQDLALFAGSALHLRDCRYFRGWDAWKRRERALFFHDARAANAAPGPAPGAAALVLLIDAGAERPVRVVEPPR